jgi:hypothetical protein
VAQVRSCCERLFALQEAGAVLCSGDKQCLIGPKYWSDWNRWLTTHLKESFLTVQSHNVCCSQIVLHLLPNANFLQHCGCPKWCGRVDAELATFLEGNKYSWGMDQAPDKIQKIRKEQG